MPFNKPLAFLRKPVEIDEHKLREATIRGAHAESLLQDELLMQAFTDVESVYLRGWRESDALDVEKRERCHVAVLLLDDLKSRLISFVREGAVARERLEKSLLR